MENLLNNEKSVDSSVDEVVQDLKSKNKVIESDPIGQLKNEKLNESVKAGEKFGKLGAYIGNEHPKLKIDWSATSNHALERMEERAISKLDVEYYVSNGKVLKQARGQYAFITKEGMAVLNEKGVLITTYSSKYYDETIKEIVNKLFGK